MTTVAFSVGEEYWDNFTLHNEDIEFLYNFLLEQEQPLSLRELVSALVAERVQREKIELAQRRISGGDLYLPKDHFQVDQRLVFPALGWTRGTIRASRPGKNPDLGPFEVIHVAMENGEQRKFAAGLANHILNNAGEPTQEDESLDVSSILEHYGEFLDETVDQDLHNNPDFVQIAGNWFPRALLISINPGHLNLAEAILDMAGGGPLPTTNLLEQIGLATGDHPKLLEFSLDHALQEDPRFDEVGPTGETLWYLHRLEPQEVLEPPRFLRYSGIDYDRSVLTKEMQAIELSLDDELSPVQVRPGGKDEVEIRLIFPHWRSGTLPLSARLRHLLPTAYEAPRIRFMLVDGESGERFPGWVVREKRYVYGLANWYRARGVIPGSLVRISRGKVPGEVILRTESRRTSKEWIRTVLVGSDGGIVFAMLKQAVTGLFDERMTIAIPDVEALAQIWTRPAHEQPSFEQVVTSTVRELAKLNPQSHVHASELYAAVNIIRRCPPGPILALLATRPHFQHVGDMHFRYKGADAI